MKLWMIIKDEKPVTLHDVPANDLEHDNIPVFNTKEEAEKFGKTAEEYGIIGTDWYAAEVELSHEKL